MAFDFAIRRLIDLSPGIHSPLLVPVIFHLSDYRQTTNMKLNAFLVPFTGLMLAYTGFTVISHFYSRSTTPSVESESPSTLSSIPSAERNLISESRSLLVVGVSSKIPITEDYRLLDSVPWELRDVSRHFREAGLESSCELLDVGADLVQPLLDVVPNVAGPLGRRSAFTIRLQVGKELGDGLPSITRGIIEDYLRSHQLTIQPTFYYNETGTVVLGPVIRAAFVRTDSPQQTSPAEAMIATSIRELRTLGAYWNKSEKFTPSECRTLILGFRYTLDLNVTLANPNPQREYEVLVLHILPGATAANPKMAVFATSDARTQFHLLEETDPNSAEQVAAITADVRFADAKLLGMYPEAPVVTKVRHRALLTIPVELVKSQIEGLGGQAPAEGFSGVLDELYIRATGDLGAGDGKSSVEVQPGKTTETDAAPR